MTRDWERAVPYRVLTEEDLQAALAPLFSDCRITRTTLLTEGLRNTNYRLDLEGRARPVVLRLHADDPRARRVELELQRRFRGVLPVPEVLHEDAAGIPGVALSVHEFLPGITLERWIDAGPDPAASRAVGRQLGEILATIHELRLPQAGFLQPGLEVEPHAAPMGLHPYAAYLLELLASPRVRARLGAPRADELASFLGQHDSLLPDLAGEVHLVHGDFKPVNLLVDDTPEGPVVAGVLDWEFAFAGVPVFDLGTLLRYDDELPPGLEAGLVEAYEGAAGALPRGWRRLALLLDLMNQLEFLRRGGDRAAADAAGRVTRTLERWEQLG